ncbi:MAG: hypothetical protein MUF49_03505 [Oculatellaceae cyanobacterium Prado106]|jgi:hypothetical protein|nr:hypothetical protein [Oculatellaceae cyanobacterium Prado106]
MEQHSFEGTWEELLRHAPELVGRHVRLTVLSHESSKPQNEITLDRLLEGRVGRVQFQPYDLSTRSKEAFVDLLTDEVRGLKLFKFTNHLQMRLETLIDRQKANLLTPEETAELAGITELDRIFTLLNAHIIAES